MKNLVIIHLLFCLYLISFFSCNEQAGSKHSKNSILNPKPIKEKTRIDTTIWSIFQDKNENYWFGSKENGVYKFDGINMIHYTTDDGLVNNQVRGIQEDNFGNIFIETTIGVSKFDGQNFSTLKMVDSPDIKGNWILKPDDLWFRIGFNKEGPYRYDGEQLHYLKFSNSPREQDFYKIERFDNYSPYGIYKIYKDKKGHMWFGTTSVGFCRFDGKHLSWHYEDYLQTTPSGGDFGSRAILEDRNSKFWFNNTRYKYEILTNHNNTLLLKKEDGIGYTNNSNEIEFPFFLNITEDNDGNLWMVTYTDGVWKYDGKELIHYPIFNQNIKVLLFTIFKDNKGELWVGTHNDGVYKLMNNTFVKQF